MVKSSWKIVILYFLVGLLWIYISDEALMYFFSNYTAEEKNWLNIIKGFLFIAITSLLLHRIITKYFKSLEKSEKEYREIFEASPYPMWIFDRDTFQFLKVNQATVKHYGFTEEEFLQMSVLEIRTEKEQEYFINFFKITKKIPHDAGVWTHKTKTGDTIKVNIKSHLIDFEKRRAVVVMAIDITEKLNYEEKLKHTIKELKFSRDNLKKTQKIAKIAGWKFILSQNQFLVYSDFNQLLGLEEQEQYISVETFKNYIDDIDFINFNHFISSFITLKNSVECTITLSLNGNPKFIRFWTENNLIDRDTGTIEGFVKDITENELKDQLVKSTLQRFELIAKATNDALYEWDVETKKVHWTGNIEKLMGYNDHTEKIHDEEWWVEHMHADDFDENNIKLLNCLRLKQPTLKRKYRFKTSDGVYKLIYDQSIIQYNKKGQVEKVIGSIQDIDELTKTNLENKKLADIISKVQNFILITDKNGLTEWTNPAFTELTGFTIEDMKGKKPGDVLQGAESSLETKQKISTAIKAQSYFSEEILNYKKSGDKYWIQIDCNPIYDDNNNHIGFIAIQSEVTERKNREDKIQEQNRLLKHVAWINSHQIRKPVASILGLIQLLNYAESQEEKDQYLNLLQVCTIELDEMVINAVKMLNSEVVNSN